MTKNYYKTETYDREHFHFGGLIYYSDFNTDYRGDDQVRSSYADRIAADMKREYKYMQLFTNKQKMKGVKK